MARPAISTFVFHGVRRFLGLAAPGTRALTILPDDVFLVSFPKSGNTWTRFLVGNLIFPDRPVTFANIHVSVPCPLGTAKKDFDRMPRPRVIKSHECFDPRYPRVIYIVRDPRDVAVSQYHYYRKIRYVTDDVPIETFVELFIAGKQDPNGAWIYGSWGQNVQTWLATSEGDPRFLMLRYEDMMADTGRELRKIAGFLGLNTTAAQITQAVERSSVARMRKLEQAQPEECDRMVGAKSRKDLMFVRAAVSGGWRKELPMPMVQKIEAAWGPVMQHLDYELESQKVSDSRLLVRWNSPQLRVGVSQPLWQNSRLNGI
jgi:Sulfotransferase domain